MNQENGNVLHVAFASDNNYIEFVAVAIASILETNKWMNHTYIHLLSNNVESSSIEKIKKHFCSESIELLTYDISDLRQRLHVEIPPTIALTSYARLFIADLLPVDINKVLYLDCDIVVNGSLKELFNYIFKEDEWIAGVLDTLPDTSPKIDIGIKPNSPYINAGVLLINLETWRRNKVSENCIHFLLKHNGNVHHHDQGIINAVCDEKKKIISPKYNMTSTYFSHPYSLLSKTNEPFYSEEEYDNSIKSPIILHFTEGFYNRPWISNSKHPYKSLYFKYRSLTEWKDSPLKQDTRKFYVKWLGWTFLHCPYCCYRILSNLISFTAKVCQK